MCGMRRNSKQYNASPARMYLLHSFSWSCRPAGTTESLAVCRVSASYSSVEQDAKPVHMDRGAGGGGTCWKAATVLCQTLQGAGCDVGKCKVGPSHMNLIGNT